MIKILMNKTQNLKATVAKLVSLRMVKSSTEMEQYLGRKR